MKAGIGSRCARALGLGLVLGALLLAGCSHESADWKQATLANSTEAYQAFLQQHPHSPEAVQAQTRIKELSAQRDWQIASAADTRDAYQQFITVHPDSKWVQEARIRIENFAQAGVSSGAALASTGSTGPAGAATTAPNTTPAPGPAAAGSAASGSAASGSAASGSAASATPGTTTPAAPAAVPATRPSAAAASSARAASRTASRSASPSAARSASHRHSTRVAAARSAHARASAHGSATGRVVQLGAFRTKARAESEWKMLSARFGALRSLTPRYVPGRSGGARVYRLQVHMSSPAAASGLCTTLKRHERPCLRVTA